MPSSRRLRCAPAQFPADGLLRPGADRPRRAEHGVEVRAVDVATACGTTPWSRAGGKRSPCASACARSTASRLEPDAERLNESTSFRDGVDHRSGMTSNRRGAGKGSGERRTSLASPATACRRARSRSPMPMPFAPWASTGARRSGRCGACRTTMPLPLFAAAQARELADEARCPLPPMPLPRACRGRLPDRPPVPERPSDGDPARAFPARGHPHRGEASAQAGCALRAAAGVVLVRQRPGNARAIFITLEDETGIANIVVWPKVGALPQGCDGRPPASRRGPRPEEPRGRDASGGAAPHRPFARSDRACQ